MKKQGLKQIFFVAMLSALMSLFAHAAMAQTSLLKPNYPASYTVVEGDTLWNIASQFLLDPERWQEIWKPDEYLDGSDLIYPGDILRLSIVGGTPRVLLTRGDRTEQKISPQIRAELLSSSIPAIPLETIENSFTRNRIISPAEFEAAPYIVANLGDNLAIGTGDEIHARGNWPVGTSTFELYREGREFRDASGENVMGLEMEYLGFASLVENESVSLKRLLVNNSSKEIRVGDRLLIREESRLDATIFPTEPVDELEGQIIAFLGNESLASQLDTVIINLGLEDNLAIGDILSIQMPGDRVVDEVERSRMTVRERFRTVFNPAQLQMPGKEIGTLLVYKTFPQMSFAVILSSTEPATLNNRVVSP